MDIRFNKAQLFNESEQILDNVQAIQLVQAGLLSKQTLMENCPYIGNMDEEIARIAQEKGTTTEE